MLYVDCGGVVVDANEAEITMFNYCDTHECRRKCPYKTECDEFEKTHDTIPYMFVKAE